MSYCENCRKTFDSTINYCPICGHIIENNIKCSNCNIDIKKKDRYCYKCGHLNVSYHYINNNTEKPVKQRQIGEFNITYNKIIKWLNSNKVMLILSLIMIFMLISLISLSVSNNPSPRSIANNYIKQFRYENPKTLYRIKDIKSYDKDIAYISIEYYTGKEWWDYDVIMVKKKFGKWQVN